jgi:hypothetical protein
MVRGHEPSPDRSLAEAERDHIVEVLRNSGNISGNNGAAARLGLNSHLFKSLRVIFSVIEALFVVQSLRGVLLSIAEPICRRSLAKADLTCW